MGEIRKQTNNLKEEFFRKQKVTKITDWQGNRNFEGQRMLVARNLELILPIGPNLTVEELQKETGCDLPWAEDHFQERISGSPSNPGKTYKYWPYHTNLDNSEYKEEIFDHTYQERFWPKKAGEDMLTMFTRVDGAEYPKMGIRFQYGDLDDVIQLLSNNPETRQAYLPIWFPEDTWAAGNSKRVPCTLGYYFWIEEGYKLHCNYIIRSCDILRHFRNDIYLTIRLLQYVAENIVLPGSSKRVEPSELTMFIFNLHLFENDSYYYNKKERKLKNQEKDENK